MFPSQFSKIVIPTFPAFNSLVDLPNYLLVLIICSLLFAFKKLVSSKRWVIYVVSLKKNIPVAQSPNFLVNPHPNPKAPAAAGGHGPFDQLQDPRLANARNPLPGGQQINWASTGSGTARGMCWPILWHGDIRRGYYIYILHMYYIHQFRGFFAYRHSLRKYVLTVLQG